MSLRTPIKARSRPPKPPQQTPNILQALPSGVLQLILGKVLSTTPQNLAELRLTCRTFNAILTPRVFATATIYMTGGNSEQLATKFRNVPSRSPFGPFTQHAKHLVIAHTMSSAGQNPSFRDCETRWILPAIASLRQVESAEITVDDFPFSDILIEVGGLTGLKTLSLRFCVRSNPLAPIPHCGFENLVEFRVSLFVFYPAVQTFIQLLLIRTRSLKKVTLEAENIDMVEPRLRELNDVLFTDTPIRSIARLSHLTVSPSLVKMSIISSPSLLSLTHLTITEDATRVHPEFWKALQRRPIHLLWLSLIPLDANAVQYLLSYTGLEGLVLGQPWRRKPLKPFDQSQVAERCYEGVLMIHRRTLRVFQFEMWAPRSWSLTQAYLDQILLCTSLSKLDLVYYFPKLMSFARHDNRNEPATRPILPLGPLLTSLLRFLPNLEKVRIFFALEELQGIDAGAEWAPVKNCWTAIEEAVVMSPRGYAPHFKLSAVVCSREVEFRVRMTHNRKEIRFVRVESGDDIQ